GAAAGAQAAVGAAGPEPRISETDTGVSFQLRNDDPGSAHRVEAASERVRAALPAVFEALGITGAGADAAGRVFGNPRIAATRVAGERASHWVRCGNAAGAGPSATGGYRTELSVLVTLKPDGAGTWVTTQVGGTAHSVAGTSSGGVLCVSNGLLEERIAEALAARLAGPLPRAR
ncbi:MAG TPA: hypothetical protein VHG51_17635, partial [Longimicrobiaceae bacterium]|nr:hypothetical protein [Longimicrobiaceae bacterium]